MIKLSVINFKRESRRKLINIILIIFISIIILNLRRDFREYKNIDLVNSNDNILDDKKRLKLETNFEFDFKLLLEKCFVFFDKEIFLCDVNNKDSLKNSNFNENKFFKR